jgi:hypothetical protein
MEMGPIITHFWECGSVILWPITSVDGVNHEDTMKFGGQRLRDHND